MAEKGSGIQNLLAAGFLFVGGAIMMLVTEFGEAMPIFGLVCNLIGVGLLLYVVFSKNGKY